MAMPSCWGSCPRRHPIAHCRGDLYPEINHSAAARGHDYNEILSPGWTRRERRCPPALDTPTRFNRSSRQGKEKPWHCHNRRKCLVNSGRDPTQKVSWRNRTQRESWEEPHHLCSHLIKPPSPPPHTINQNKNPPDPLQSVRVHQSNILYWCNMSFICSLNRPAGRLKVKEANLCWALISTKLLCWSKNQ